MRKRILFVVVAGLALSGCNLGEQPLAGVGHASGEWVHGADQSTTTSTPATTTTTAPVEAIDVVTWVNDDLGAPGEDEDPVARVLERRVSFERFVQASRFEIAAALPGIRFPEVLPSDVRFVTSQLVYSGDRLDPAEPAAFGLWTVEPYTKSRSVAQRGVLLVGFAVGAESAADLCPDTGTCSPLELSGGVEAASVDLPEGWTLIWEQEGYRYELFLRGMTTPDVPVDVAASVQPLAGLP